MSLVLLVRSIYLTFDLRILILSLSLRFIGLFIAIYFSLTAFLLGKLNFLYDLNLFITSNYSLSNPSKLILVPSLLPFFCANLLTFNFM